MGSGSIYSKTRSCMLKMSSFCSLMLIWKKIRQLILILDGKKSVQWIEMTADFFPPYLACAHDLVISHLAFGNYCYKSLCAVWKYITLEAWRHISLPSLLVPGLPPWLASSTAQSHSPKRLLLARMLIAVTDYFLFLSTGAFFGIQCFS